MGEGRAFGAQRELTETTSMCCANQVGVEETKEEGFERSVVLGGTWSGGLGAGGKGVTVWCQEGQIR